MNMHKGNGHEGFAAGADQDFTHLSELIGARVYDQTTETYECASGKALILEVMPLIGMDADGAKTLVNFVNDIDLGDGTIQVLNWASHRIAEPLHRWAQARGTDETGITASRIGMFSEAAKGNNPRDTRWRPRQIRVFFIIWLPSERHAGPVDMRLVTIKQRLRETFIMLGTQSRVVGPEALLSLYLELLAPDLSEIDHPRPRWSHLQSLAEQCVAPGHTLSAGYKELRFSQPAEARSDILARHYTLQQLPERWLPGSAATMIGDIFRAHRLCPWPLLQCLSFKMADFNRDAVSLSSAKKDKAANSIFRYVMPQLVREAADLRQLNDALSDGESAVKMLFHCVLYAPEGELVEAEASLKGLFSSADFRMAAEHGLHLAGLNAALPLGATDQTMRAMQQLRRLKTVMLRNAATLMPLFGEWRGNNMRQPGIMLTTGRRGQLAGWTPWQSDGNFNVSIVGMSGQGKSVAMQEMMNGILATGGSVVVIDDGYSFQNAATLMGGAHVDFGDEDLRINPFAAVQQDLVKGDLAEEVTSMLVAFCSALAHPGSETGDIERSILIDVVQSVWSTKGNDGSIDDVVETLQADGRPGSDDLVTLLKPFTSDGAFGARFAGGCSARFDSRLVVFEMSALRQRHEIRAAAMVLLIFLATQRMFTSPRDHRVAIMVDEAWALLEGTSAKFIEGVARRARKYNGALICATQGVDEFFRNPSAEAAWSTSDWTIFFKQKESSIATLKREQRIDLERDPVLEKALRSLNSIRDAWSELVIHGPGGWDIHRLLLDDVSLTAFSSSGDDVAAIEALIAGGKTRAEAIAHHAGTIRSGSATTGGQGT